MRNRWMIAGAVVLLALAVAIVYGQGAGQAQTRLDTLTVRKSVDKPAIAPGETVLYTVMITNITEEPVEVPSVVDTLPDGFDYIGLAWNSDWDTEAWDSVPPVIQWAGPKTIGASGSLALRYWVHVPESVPLRSEPYTNTVVVSETYQDEAGLVVGVGQVTLAKSATPTRAYPGEPVTYTLAFDNRGYVTRTLSSVTDVLPPGVTFEEMTGASDVSDPPSGSTGTIVWTGPYTVDPQDPFLVQYRATMPTGDDPKALSNEAWGVLGDETLLGPDSAEVKVSTSHTTTLYLPFVAHRWAPPRFAATKTATPNQVYGQEPAPLIAYEVLLSNLGTLPGELADIHDTLPSGFTFVRMLSGSDISSSPSGTTGEIVWPGPFTVPGESSLRVKYEVRANITPASYTNSVLANVSKGQPSQVSASATVVVREPFLLVEEWSNPSPYWEEYLNYWRLNSQQWHIKPTGGDDGAAALGHAFYLGVSDPEDGAHDALITYKGPGAEQWTNYEFKVRGILNSDDGTERGQFGVWFRGTVEQEGQLPGRYVTGYYFSLQPKSSDERVMLLQMRTDDECGDDCAFNYHFSNPLILRTLRDADLDPLGLDIKRGRWYWLKVRVEGPRIRCYINDVLVIDYYDNVGTTFTEGSVGFYTYIAGDARFDHVTVIPLN